MLAPSCALPWKHSPWAGLCEAHVITHVDHFTTEPAFEFSVPLKCPVRHTVTQFVSLFAWQCGAGAVYLEVCGF